MTNLYEAIILAGGQGTQLRSVISDIPKPLAPVANYPFLDILAGWLAPQGIQRLVLSLEYSSENIARHVGKNYMGLETIV